MVQSTSFFFVKHIFYALHCWKYFTTSNIHVNNLTYLTNFNWYYSNEILWISQSWIVKKKKKKNFSSILNTEKWYFMCLKNAAFVGSTYTFVWNWVFSKDFFFKLCTELYTYWQSLVISTMHTLCHGVLSLPQTTAILQIVVNTYQWHATLHLNFVLNAVLINFKTIQNRIARIKNTEPAFTLNF